MVILRRDIGYRMLNTLVLMAVFGVLAVVAILALPGKRLQGRLICSSLPGLDSGRASRSTSAAGGILSGMSGSTPITSALPLLTNAGFRPFFRRNRRSAPFLDPLLLRRHRGGVAALFPRARLVADFFHVLFAHL